jgi:hypothetical protein
MNPANKVLAAALPRLDARPTRPWSALRLKRLGSVADQTAKVTNMGVADGGSGFMMAS